MWGMSAKQIICNQDFATMQKARVRLEVSNIELARVDDGFVCEVCQRFYAPTEGYRWLENGNIQRAKRLCGHDACGAQRLNMALTVAMRTDKKRGNAPAAGVQSRS